MHSSSAIDDAIIDLLSQSHAFVSASNLGKKLGVSTKTIYRAIKRINQSSTTILTEKGKGVRLADSYSPQSVVRDYEGITPIERRNDIILKLLFRAPQQVDMDFLFQNTFVSAATQESDMMLIKKQVNKFGLVLNHHSSTYAIQGNELKIRDLMSLLIQKSSTYTGDGAIKDANRFDTRFINDQLRTVETQTGGNLAYPYNVNIFSHLYILIARARRGDVINSWSVPNSEMIQAEINQNIALYRLAELIIENVQNYVGKPLPQNETMYLFQYLISSRLVGTHSQDRVIKYSDEVMEISKLFLQGISEQLNVNLNSEIFLKELADHVAPMINRLRNKVRVVNGLIKDIQREYQELFHDLQIIGHQIITRFGLPKISDNEIGFLTLYFAKFLEEAGATYHVLIVCASGIGTSELLRVKIKKSFPNIIVDGVLSGLNPEVIKKNYRSIDLIVSTIRLPESIQKPIVIVSALLNESDRMRIQRSLKKVN